MIWHDIIQYYDVLHYNVTIWYNIIWYDIFEGTNEEFCKGSIWGLKATEPFWPPQLEVEYGSSQHLRHFEMIVWIGFGELGYPKMLVCPINYI